MSSEGPVTSQSVSKQRRQRSQKTNKRSGLLLGLVVVLVAGGAVWYWTQLFVPERNKSLYEEETHRLVSELNSKTNQLSENSSEEALESYENELKALANREGVGNALVDPLIANLEGFKRKKEGRSLEFEALLDEVSTFPLDSTREEIQAFDNKIFGAVTRLERMQGGKLHYEWLERRKEVVSELKQQSVGELTIRSDPSKADVYMDGKRIAQTPFRASRVKTGSHEIVLKKPGYKDKRISVTIEKSGDNDLGIQVLDPIVGSVQIVVSGGKPRDKVQIELEEESEGDSVGGLEVVQGYQHFEGREHLIDALRIGEYSLIVTVNGEIAKETSFVVSEGETRQVNVEL